MTILSLGVVSRSIVSSCSAFPRWEKGQSEMATPLLIVYPGMIGSHHANRLHQYGGSVENQHRGQAPKRSFRISIPTTWRAYA